ncbi:MAG: phosphatidylserine decarboxylase family protein [Flammeovirgaceae bacterium]|nr:phosphatidylserine decarboxylase family protein [Flammeovirgaceae bacterium]MDW8287300.1 phosphatidylserine decarboxylase family protein [Flammeovirgaceae bacterium]
MTIHREGYRTLGLVAALLVVSNIASLYFLNSTPFVQYSIAFFSIILFLIVLQFFRNPLIKVVKNPKHVLAPADGKVVVIEEVVENEYFHAPRKQISIFMSPFNVHVNRNPISGVVRYFKYHPGEYLVAWHPKASTENERTTIVVRNEQNHEILFRQIAGALARRIKCYIKEGDTVEQGAEFGFIKFGSRVDVFLPLHSKINVSLNDKTVAGKTVIAEI